MSITLNPTGSPPQVHPFGAEGFDPAAASTAGQAGSRFVHTGPGPRIAALSTVRLLMVVITAAVAVADPALAMGGRARVAAVAAAWLLVWAAAEWARRAQVFPTVLSRAVPLVDGLLLVAATVMGGGSSSPLCFLAFLHVIAVTILASYLTGLKVAVWDSALLLVAAAAETAGAIPFLPAGDGGQAAAAAIRSVSLLLVTAVTAGASALNERELRRSRSGLEAMLATSNALMGAGRPEEAMQIALAVLCGPMDFVSAAVLIAPAEGHAMAARRRRGVEAAPVRADRDLTVSPPQEPLLRADPADLDDPVLSALLDDQPNVVAVPVVGQRGVGVLAASLGGRPRDRGLPVRTLELVESLAAQLAQTLDRIQLSSEIAEMAASDGLTGVANRRHFDEQFERMLQSAQTTGQPLAVLAIDIDHFKLVNDRHGHQVGDEVLRAVARTLRRHKRADDFLARYGGEEFALLLPVTGLDDGVEVASRLRRAVVEADTIVGVTISVGVASTAESGLDPTRLFDAADRALYAAKEAGRNRVHSPHGPCEHGSHA